MKRAPLLFAAWFALTTVAQAQSTTQQTTPAAAAMPAAVAAPSTQTPPPAAAQLAVQTPPPAPEPSRERPASNTDEAGLWDLADRAEQQARQSGQLESDTALNAYVHDVACRVADGVCGDIRLYILNHPFFNAAMAPNGYMEVWSGLLLRCDDEAQLAFVLGHEVGHYAERHTLLQWRTVRGRATAGLILSMVSAGVGAALIGDLVYLGALSSVFAYSRELESTADAIGFNRAVAAGYDPQAGVALWTSLIAETQSSNDPEVRRKETRGSVFATHPLSADRVAALRTLANQHGAGGETFHARYRAAIRPFLDRWLRAELRRRISVKHLTCSTGSARTAKTLVLSNSIAANSIASAAAMATGLRRSRTTLRRSPNLTRQPALGRNSASSPKPTATTPTQRITSRHI